MTTETGADVALAYQFNGDVEGESGQHIANQARLVVHPASIYVGVRRPPTFVDITAPVRVEVVAANLDGTPARAPVTITLLRQEWAPVLRPQTPGSSSWERQDVEVGQWPVTTPATAGPAGTPETASVAMTIRDAGAYILRATARDAAGRPTRTDVPFYAFGRGRASWKSEGNQIDLVPERQTWKPGESARILIQSPWDRATALLTTEREGVRSHRQFANHVDAGCRPGADHGSRCAQRLCVRAPDQGPHGDRRQSRRRGPRQRPRSAWATRRFLVDDPAKRLHVDVRSDHAEYRPKQQATVSVAVTDASGAPAPSEVTLWAVDYGLLSLTGYSDA